MLVDWLEPIIRFLVERSAVVDLHLGVAESGVARHYSSRSIVEPDAHGILKRVVDELGAVRIHDLERLFTTDDDIVLENVVL